jgi:putative ABC transport system substrate-binding protein
LPESRCRELRRAIWMGLLLAFGVPGAGVTLADGQVVLVSMSGVRPFEEAVEGFRAGFNKAAPPLFIDLRSASGESELAEVLQQGSAHVVVTAGTEALSAVVARNYGGPVLAMMVLRADAAAVLSRSAPPRRLLAVYLDVPLADVALELKSLFPGKKRLGLMRNVAREGRPDAPWLAALRQQGFLVQVAECSAPEDLLRSFLSLKRKADFVLLAPDSSLYNEATARPLILASLENQLPIVGFSASFVRAGAALGIYPDYADIGRQAAEAAHRFAGAGDGSVEETPRKLVVAVNQRVMRLLGLEPQARNGFSVTVIK